MCEKSTSFVFQKINKVKEKALPNLIVTYKQLSIQLIPGIFRLKNKDLKLTLSDLINIARQIYNYRIRNGFKAKYHDTCMALEMRYYTSLNMDKVI